MKGIKRKTERLFWMLSLFLVIGVFYIVPSANSFKNQDEQSYYDKLLRTAFQYLNEFYVDSKKVDIKKLYYGAIHGMFKATGDPYTTMLEPKVLKGLMESIHGEFEGIGAYVGMRDNRIMIISPIEGTPAYRAGVKPGDVIMKIEKKDTEGMKLEEAVSLLRGKANTKVNIEIYRKGVPKLLKITIQRNKIEIPSVKSKMLPYGVGYIKINNFAETTPDEMEKAIERLERKGMKKMIIDLRYNPGGSLGSVIEVADMFLDEGLIVYTVGKKRSETKKFFATEDMKVDPVIPLAVLTNKGSASASEIFSGAMKDRNRGVVVGEKTFGKGTVQNVFKVFDKKDMLGLKITIAKYYTPSGYEINGKGIQPNVKVSMPKMTTQEEFYSIKLLKEKYIQKFVAQYSKRIPRRAFQRFKRKLKRKGIILRDVFLKKFIRGEQNLTHGPKVVDLEYDAQLKKAINILRKK